MTCMHAILNESKMPPWSRNHPDYLTESLGAWIGALASAIY